MTSPAENEKWFAVSLRFFGDRLPLDEIEGLLGLRPERIGRIGEYIPRKIRPDWDPARIARFRTNFWLWRSPATESTPFEEQIEPLVALLEARRTNLARILATPGTTGDLFLGFSSANGQGGARFSPELLARIGALGLAVSLDLYPPGPPEDEPLPAPDHDPTHS